MNFGLDVEPAKPTTTQIAIDASVVPGVECIEATVFTPATPASVVVVATPGGGMSRRYFDLDLDGYSMAAHLAGRGITVVTIDLPGVGSTPPPADPRALNPDALGAILASAAQTISARFGGAAIVGLGHSMGAMLTLIAQAHHRPFASLVLLGWSGRGLPEVLLPDEAALVGRPNEARAAIADLAQARFGDLLPQPATRGTDTTASDFLLRVPIGADVRTALRRANARMLTQAGLWAMIPGISTAEHRAIDCRVLCGVAEMDITGDPADLPGHLPNAGVDVYVQPGAGHNSNVAPTRSALWDAVADWCLSHGG